MADYSFDTVTLSLEDGREVECSILRIFPAGGARYIALLPLKDNDDEEVYLYRYDEDESGEPSLGYIDSDEEYELVSDAFEEELDAMEMEELADEAEDAQDSGKS